MEFTYKKDFLKKPFPEGKASHVGIHRKQAGNEKFNDDNAQREANDDSKGQLFELLIKATHSHPCLIPFNELSLMQPSRSLTKVENANAVFYRRHEFIRGVPLGSFKNDVEIVRSVCGDAETALIHLYCIFSALNYLHTFNLVHMDISHLNTLLDNRGLLRIFDYEYTGLKGSIESSHSGTPRYYSFARVYDQTNQVEHDINALAALTAFYLLFFNANTPEKVTDLDKLFKYETSPVSMFESASEVRNILEKQYSSNTLIQILFVAAMSKVQFAEDGYHDVQTLWNDLWPELKMIFKISDPAYDQLKSLTNFPQEFIEKELEKHPPKTVEARINFSR